VHRHWLYVAVEIRAKKVKKKRNKISAQSGQTLRNRMQAHDCVSFRYAEVMT